MPLGRHKPSSIPLILNLLLNWRPIESSGALAFAATYDPADRIHAIVVGMITPYSRMEE